MSLVNDLKRIETLKEVDQFIITDSDGNIVAQRISNPEKTARMVSLCGKNFYAIGKSNFKFCMFSRKKKQNFFIFPVGNYYLGVIKQKEIKNFILADTINNFLTDAMKKRPKTRRPI